MSGQKQGGEEVWEFVWDKVLRVLEVVRNHWYYSFSWK